MADTTQFDHDRLGHLLSDRLLQVPPFQRSYSWDRSNVEEYLSDLASAREKDSAYFMGTVVFAQDKEDPDRQQVVDGQQRLATTAVLLCAVRDRLHIFGKEAQAKHIDETYLRGYDLLSEEYVDRLVRPWKPTGRSVSARRTGSLSQLCDQLYTLIKHGEQAITRSHYRTVPVMTGNVF